MCIGAVLTRIKNIVSLCNDQRYEYIKPVGLVGPVKHIKLLRDGRTYSALSVHATVSDLGLTVFYGHSGLKTVEN